jgi:hypothetical protein
MNSVERAEHVRWLDALDALSDSGTVDKGMQLARAYRHRDAVWFAALFPGEGADVTPERVVAVMSEHGEDPRAMHLSWMLGKRHPTGHMRRAAEMGYAPAQGILSVSVFGAERMVWAQKAALQFDRFGLNQLAHCVAQGWGCAKDEERAKELYRQAAELGHRTAQFTYGETVFGAMDWQRFYWWGEAAKRGYRANFFCDAVVALIPAFARGENGRILHVVSGVIRDHLDSVMREIFGRRNATEFNRMRHVLLLWEAMLDRARLSIACWSVVGRRLGVAKDVRVMIAKMAWEEVWRWGEKAKV